MENLGSCKNLRISGKLEFISDFQHIGKNMKIETFCVIMKKLHVFHFKVS